MKRYEIKMKKSVKHTIVGVCSVVTFLIPIAQIVIGFHFLVSDGEDPNIKCQAAPDLPILLGMGGVFTLLFFGSVYGCLKMISSIMKVQSDTSGKGPKILLGR